MGAVEVWLLDGPADGRLLLVETDVAGRLPTTVTLPQTGFAIGRNDDLPSCVDHVYRRADDIEGYPTYQYEPIERTAT